MEKFSAEEREAAIRDAQERLAHLQRMGVSPVDFQTMDFFKPDVQKKFLPGSMKPRRAPAQVPEADILFAIQKNLVFINKHYGDDDYRDAIIKRFRDSYRDINTYLQRYGGGDHQTPNPFGGD